MSERVKCIECENLILPQTARDNSGLCAPCANTPPQLREADRQFRRKIVDGSYFQLSEAERTSAATPEAFAKGIRWDLQPDFYSSQKDATPNLVVEEAEKLSSGNIFLVTDSGDQLNVGFSAKYAVCEYQNPDSGQFRVALSDQRLTRQAEEEFHVSQDCPCCGVSMLWYPSRYHLPRQQAFDIVRRTINHEEMPEIFWIEMEDISYASPGCG